MRKPANLSVTEYIQLLGMIELVKRRNRSQKGSVGMDSKPGWIKGPNGTRICTVGMGGHINYGQNVTRTAYLRGLTLAQQHENIQAGLK